MEIQWISLHNNENQWTIYDFLSKIMETYKIPMFWYGNQWDCYQHEWKYKQNQWVSTKPNEN